MTVFKKSLLTLSLAALGFAAVFAVLVLVFMNSLYYGINAAGLSSTAKTLIAVIGEERIKEFFIGGKPVTETGLQTDSAYRVTLINTDGSVLWDSQVADGLVNHIDRKEITAALEGREGITWRNSLSTGDRRIYCALPVLEDGGKPVGIFRVSLVVPEYSARVSSVVLPFLIFVGFWTAAVFAAVFVYSRSLSNSLGRLVDIVQAGASLLSDPEAGKPVAPEFPSLERALRVMTRELNFRFEQARAEGSRLEAILNGMTEAVFAMDSALVLHLVNPRAREIFNLGQKDIYALSLLEATRSTELEGAAKKALLSGAPLEMELTFHTGQEQSFQVFAAPLSGGGVVLVMQENTRLLKLERIRKDFVANVSHELRTPIQLIKGFSETLTDSVSELNGGNDQILRFIEIIRKNAGTMENLVNDLLILAGLENGGSKTFEPEEQYLAALLAEAVSSVEPQAKRKQTEIIVSCPEELKASLYGSFIIQALINLIDNGIKYSPPKSKIRVSAYQEETELVLEVWDKGIGISSEHLERIFERFYRVDRARSREAGGTGLGLSIVRHIALLHKGKTEVESHAGEGSTFRIRIPLHLHQNRESRLIPQ